MAPRGKRKRARPTVPSQVPVVGIGASAGGLEALKAFFGAMPSTTGVAFVVVVHLDPTHASLLPELLAKSTTVGVEQVRDRQLLEADHVYIIPPNRTLTLHEGRLSLQKVEDRQALRHAIDHFFRSLADDRGDRAIAVVLSGTGTEGTLGGRAVKENGGMVMAQRPDTASQPGMPASVIATGMVDMVLPPGEMPGALLNYVRSSHLIGVAPETAEGKTAHGLSDVLAVLRARTKYDFRGYKSGTLQRRIERRMGLQQIESVPRYARFLRTHPAEADQLFKDLLIGVTSFFRDPPAFEELASKVVPGLVKGHDSDSPIRVWVPGCATGEEAYSIAIVISEQIAAAHASCPLQVFGTDVDDHALDIARGGTYPESIALDVSPERLQRFFTREDHRYTISKSIRQSVTFAAQNVISDPPFSKLDLVSCRNLLIYLDAAVQERVLTLFHFALNPGGYLFLGNAEGIGPLGGDLFASMSKRWRIFRRLGPVKGPALEFSAMPRPTSAAGRVRPETQTEQTVAALADQQLLEEIAPPALVVKRTGEIVRLYGQMDRYIRLPTGEATLDVLTLARDALKPALRAALYDAVRNNRQRVHEALDIKRDKHRATLRISVRPVRVPRTADNLWFIIFEESPAAPSAAARPAAGKPSDLIRRLEAELRTTKKEQHRLVEQLENSNEELKAANEEILSMNEELQSTNEELVTSKEELQSMNEELTTLNGQLQEKVQELTSVNDDLANLLVSSDIATVFLDTDFRIKRFTTAAIRLLNLLPSDVGRPLSHLTTNLVSVDLSRDAHSVLRHLAPVEKEVASQDGKQYLVRVLPYRSQSQKVQGIVLTLVDVTTLKQTEHELRMTRNQLRQLNDTLEQRVSERTKWLRLLHDVTEEISNAPSWDEALRLVLHRICESEHWQVGFVYLPDRDMKDAVSPAISWIGDERFRPFLAASEHQRYLRQQSLPGRVYADGVPVRVNDQEQLLELTPVRREVVKGAGLRAAAALPIHFGREIIAVLELFSDQPHAPDELLENLMTDVSAHIGDVLERERVTAQMADLSWREQQELLHTLHDSLGQTLTGLGMLSAGLKQQLVATDRAAADTARQVAEQAQLALQQVRQLSRGLFPIDIDAENLMPALRELASTTEAFHKIRVQVDGQLSASIRDSRVATQLYRIAQEGVTNAVKHARAHRVSIELSAASGLTKLRVSDDGVGVQKRSSASDGLGLRIMRYRATSIGALLSIDSHAGGGTTITCTLRETPLAAESDTPR